MPGTFDAKKGRISVPSLFRNVLAGTGSPQDLIARKSDHSPCIEIWPKATFEAEVERRIAELDPFAKDYEKKARRLVARVHPLTPDAEWRMVLPRELTEKAPLQGEVMFSGRIRFFQLWSKADWDAVEAEDAEEEAA